MWGYLFGLFHIFVKISKNDQEFVNLSAWFLRDVGRVKDIVTPQKCFSFSKYMDWLFDSTVKYFYS